MCRSLLSDSSSECLLHFNSHLADFPERLPMRARAAACCRTLWLRCFVNSSPEIWALEIGVLYDSSHTYSVEDLGR